MELRHLRYFVAVAEELHFRKAAERLHVAQPAVSEQVRKLEQELGVRLFNSTQRSVALTTAGTALLEDGEPAALVRAVTRLGRGGRIQAKRPRRKNSSREVPMLTPKVTEITRGCAHASATARIKTGAGSRQGGNQSWNSAI